MGIYDEKVDWELPQLILGKVYPFVLTPGIPIILAISHFYQLGPEILRLSKGWVLPHSPFKTCPVFKMLFVPRGVIFPGVFSLDKCLSLSHPYLIGDVAQVVEHLLCKCKALNSNPSPTHPSSKKSLLSSQNTH
jgi:hypothetical protein